MVRAVRTNSPDDRRQVNHHLRLRVGVEAFDICLPRQVILAPPGDHDLRAPTRPQCLDDILSQEPCSTRHHDPFVAQLHHGLSP